MSDLISQIEEREGGSKVTNEPQDGGGRTQYGISERAHPNAWLDGKVTEEEARAIYEQKYVKGPGFDRLPQALQPLLIDWGVVSGPQLVIGQLQDALGATKDGILGPVTIGMLPDAPGAILGLRNTLVGARIRQIGRIVAKNPSQLKYLNGWLNRALEFLL